MVSVGDAVGSDSVAARFLAAVCNQDWECVESCFTPDAKFQALLPKGLRAGDGAAAATGYLRQWLGDADQLVLLDSDVRTMQDQARYSLPASRARGSMAYR